MDVGCFYVVFTVPQELNAIIYHKQRKLYNLLFRTVAETLQELAMDEKYPGGTIGHTAVLRTWGQNLLFHPHIHCIVPTGELTKLRFWQNSRKKFFLPVKALSRKFRGKFLALLQEQGLKIEESLLDCCYKKEWVVYCKPPFKTASCVVEYLGRYTHRVAVSNNRLLKLADGKVTFKWQDYKDNSKWKEMTVFVDEFIHRFLMHILPHGFMKIRHYGFLSSRGKQKKLKLCKLLTGTKLIDKVKAAAEDLIEKLIGRKPFVCPTCGCQKLFHTALSPPVLAI